jgi:hypothetical protein
MQGLDWRRVNAVLEFGSSASHDRLAGQLAERGATEDLLVLWATVASDEPPALRVACLRVLSSVALHGADAAAAVIDALVAMTAARTPPAEDDTEPVLT